MLLGIDIKNIALIEKLNIEVIEGMTVLTGETGAGKTNIIDAVNLLLGARGGKTDRYGRYSLNEKAAAERKSSAAALLFPDKVYGIQEVSGSI